MVKRFRIYLSIMLIILFVFVHSLPVFASSYDIPSRVLEKYNSGYKYIACFEKSDSSLYWYVAKNPIKVLPGANSFNVRFSGNLYRDSSDGWVSGHSDGYHLEYTTFKEVFFSNHDIIDLDDGSVFFSKYTLTPILLRESLMEIPGTMKAVGGTVFGKILGTFGLILVMLLVVRLIRRWAF